MRRGFALPLAAALVLAAAACGGGGKSNGPPSGPPLTKAAYQAKVQEVAKQISTKLGSAAADSSELTDQAIEAVSAGMQSFADELADINPPTEIESLHKDLIQAMRELADELGPILQKVSATKDPTQALTALFGAEAIQHLTKVQEQLKAKGYDFNLSG